jgi:hypothetical protein
MMDCAARICLIVLLSCGVAGLADAKPKHYFELRGVNEPAKKKPSLKAAARALLTKAFEKDPRIATSLGEPAPKGAELTKALKAKKMTGYALDLRITKVDHSMNPPPPGKVYKILMVEVGVAIDAEKIPSSQMALAGEGNAQIGTEVSRFKEKERVQLLHEALAEAIKQAALKTVNKLTSSGKKKRRRKARRRRR